MGHGVAESSEAKCKCGRKFDSIGGLRNHIRSIEKRIEKGKSASQYHRHHSGLKWSVKRIIAKLRDGNRCTKCGITQKEHLDRDDLFGQGLHVHHIIPVKEFSNPQEAHELWNLETLCAQCHREAEFN